MRLQEMASELVQQFQYLSISTTLDKTTDYLRQLPWWVYLASITVILVFILFLFFFRKKSSKKKDNNYTPLEEPITARKSKIKIIPGNAQHIGMRSEQQDAFGFSDINDEEFIEQYGVLAVLADGMGGLQGGKEASNLAVQTFLNHYLHSHHIFSLPEKLLAAVTVANEAVLNFAKAKSLEGGVGTTLIATVIHQNTMYWLSVGDSRIYLKSDNGLTQLTTDHIYARELDQKVFLGEISEEEALADPQRESLTSYLGLENLVEIDVSVESIPLQLGDTIFLCSDGLYGSVTHDEILDACRFSTQETADILVETVLQKRKPHQDNATIALLTLGE